MHAVSMNWVAIMVAAFVAYVGGVIWYSPVMFGRAWMVLVGMNEADADAGGTRAPLALIVHAIVTVVATAVIAVVVSWAGANNPLEGAAVGLLLSGGLIATDHVKLLAFERRSFRLFAINNAYTVLALIIMGAILGLWH